MLKLNTFTVPVIWSTRISPVSAFLQCAGHIWWCADNAETQAGCFRHVSEEHGLYDGKDQAAVHRTGRHASANASNLLGIDSVANEAIMNQATPGCVVLVAKDGKVIFNKAYGYHTYDKNEPDELSDIFDLASMTKISATTMETMQLYDQHKLNIDTTLGYYLPQAQKHQYQNGIHVRDVLEHQEAGLIPDIPTVEAVKPTDYTLPLIRPPPILPR